MPLTATDRLRDYLGEKIPLGGSDADTLFTDDEVQDILLNTPDNPGQNLYLCAAEGWRRKASILASLVTSQTGGSQRQMSDLHERALAEEERYRELAAGRRTPRVGRITRPGTTIY